MLRKLTIRGLLAHKARFRLAMLAVVLGAAFVSGTIILTDSVRNTVDNQYTDETKVDATGLLALPYITFSQTLRVKTLVTVEPIAGAKTTRRQVSYFFECFGEVARIASANNEPAEDFTEAAEFRRLGLGP